MRGSATRSSTCGNTSSGRGTYLSPTIGRPMTSASAMRPAESCSRRPRLQTAFRLLTRSQLNTSQAIERIRAEAPPSAGVDELIAFIQASQRGFIK